MTKDTGGEDRPLRIGFDVAQTCQERAGCGWYADALVRAMAAVAPVGVEILLYHHFGRWINHSVQDGTRLDGSNVAAPLRDLSPADAAALWRADADDGEPAEAGPLGRPDIVHANCHQAPRVRGARLVYTVYDVSFWRVPEFSTEANRLICQAGLLEALRNADGFVFISESAHREFEAVLPGWLETHGKPWAVTPLAPRAWAEEPAVGTPDADTATPGDGDKPEVFWLAAGSLEPRKNYATLFDALELYWARSPQPRPLTIAGGAGWKSDDLRARLARLEAEGKARHLGYVSEARLRSLYQRAFCFLFPSWYEGFGLPVVEAMGQGCPVICSGRTSLPEVGGDAVVYIDPADAGSIAAAMLALEADPARRDTLAAAGRTQARGFTWERTARETLAFYRRVLAAPAGGGTS